MRLRQLALASSAALIGLLLGWQAAVQTRAGTEASTAGSDSLEANAFALGLLVAPLLGAVLAAANHRHWARWLERVLVGLCIGGLSAAVSCQMIGSGVRLPLLLLPATVIMGAIGTAGGLLVTHLLRVPARALH